MNASSFHRWALCAALASAGCASTATSDAGTDAPTVADAATDTPTVTDAVTVTDTPAVTDAVTVTDTPTVTDAAALDRFSFFVTSLRALQALSGSESGFGGDLRYGETGPGAGLRGADRICAAVAERSMPGASAKQWRAFLSARDGGDGTQVNAIDRIGAGPWYDRLGRLFANNRTELLNDRPSAANPMIRNDFPNEDGVPNHQPDPTAGQVDNHDMLTGTNNMGQLYSNTATCLDWTSAMGNVSLEGTPRVGHSWPRGMGGMGGPGGMNPANWMSSLNEAGCAPGVSLIEMGPPNPRITTVGSGGGYGGFYCFALTP